ncbi:hypothetical protein EGW08_006055 [Elysia chlorotica]|uniref:Insulin-like domain-containing protein n=1 Tax=Elysia chlorotica TaxID=188477 RepID=A0A3S1HU29_ELYCH|nr:hypothetical protein EGW08_006055 [Elysia chlorotica]
MTMHRNISVRVGNSDKMASLFQKSVAYLLMLACLHGSATAQSRLCGRALADTLDIVCAGRGFHLGKRSVRSVRHVEEVPFSDAHAHILAPHEPSFTSEPVGDAATKPEARKPQTFLSLLSSSLASNDLDSKSETSGVSDGKGNRMVGSVSDVTRLGSKQAQSFGDNGANVRGRTSAVSQRPERVRRQTGGSVVDECCLQACSFATLESYCAAADEPVQELSMDELRRRLGLSVNVGGSSSGDQARPPYTAPRFRPSAEIIRNNVPNQSGPFFYLSLGNQATRSPLIE